MKNLYRKATVKRAKALLAAPGGKGDHGFTGKQLKVWEKMRDGWRDALTAIVQDKPVPRKYMDFEPECPRDAAPLYVPKNKGDKALLGAPQGHVWHVGCVYVNPTAMKKNPNYSKGTPEGQRWAATVPGFISDAFDDLDYRQQIEDNIEDAQDRLTEAQDSLASFLR